MTRLAVALDGEASLEEVGGKGLSLMRMTRAGLPVPPGVVLTAAFFRPWIDALRALPAWVEPDPARRGGALRAAAAALPFAPEQRAALPAEGVWAVRSSSPEEDLEGSSFAGLYETILGVPPARMEEAVRRAFASCLDARVALYKRQRGLDPGEPRIAVVLQRQIESEVAGVAFSLHPVTNDYDQALIAANWGLGETVVAGVASPDEFTVDKVGRRILERRLGRKEACVRVAPGGGTEARAGPPRAGLCLADEEVLEIADAAARVEGLYGLPVDIEWAFAGGRLFLLQARPVTTHLALPDDLVTPPGAPRRLYADATTSVQGILKPMSPMGTSILARLVGGAMRAAFGRDLSADPLEAIATARHGRLYVNLSNLVALAGRDAVTRAAAALDPVLADALRAADGPAWRGRRPPIPWRLALRAAAAACRALAAFPAPARARRRCDAAVEAYRERIAALGASADPLASLADRALPPVIRLVFGRILPLLVASKIAMGLLRRLLRGAPGVERLDQSLPGNVTVEMGLALARVARGEETWEGFLGRYGHRGPGELDVAAPRFRERPALLRGLLPGAAAAEAAHGESRRARLAAARALLRRRRGLSALYRVVESLGGCRETPKFSLILALDLLRRRALAEGERLAAAGRLDRPGQIFDLALEDLDVPDLRARAAERRRSHDRLARFPELPRLFDSRGRILRPPPRPAREGEIAGYPVSPGVARGPAKVLAAPDEKPLLPGEVLVARATDPGWTPLFLHAAAVVLEVGGPLQHGALVAREYGRPCVVGVERATERLRDGQMIEVDGGAGIVRIVG